MGRSKTNCAASAQQPVKAGCDATRLYGLVERVPERPQARIGEFLAHCSAAQDELRPLRSRLPTLSGWQYFEYCGTRRCEGLVRQVARQLSCVVETGMENCRQQVTASGGIR